MKTIKLEVELTYDAYTMHGDDQEAKDWFYNFILKEDKLALFSQEIGDIIGEIKVVEVKESGVE